MGSFPFAVIVITASLLWPGPVLAERSVACLLPFNDARPVKSPASVPYQVRAESTPEPIRAHPPEGPKAVRRMVLKALAAEPGLEVVDLAGADRNRLDKDQRASRCAIFVDGAVFHYEGTVAVDIYGSKIYSGLVGFEFVALEPNRGQFLVPPVAFAGRRQSEPVKADDDFGTNDRQLLDEWIDEALKVASISIPARFVRPVAAVALRPSPAPK